MFNVIFRKTVFSVVAVILSGILLFVAFPPYNLAFLAWIALVPLFLAITGRKPVVAFLLSFISGSIFFLGIFNWILVVGGYTYLHHAILAIYLGFYFAIFGGFFALVSRYWGMVPACVAAPFIWISLEYLRSNLSFLALPWGLLAHSQHQNLIIIQVASIAGAYGVSFLIVLANAALATLLYPWIIRRKIFKAESSERPTRKSISSFAVAAVTLILLSLVYGIFVLTSPIEGNQISVSVVQGNIEQLKKLDKKYAPLIIRTYEDLTLAAARSKPNLIIWPETATPKSINADPGLKKRVKHIAESAGAYLLIGSSHVFKFKRNVPKSAKVRNSALLVSSDPKAKILQQYDKIRLFPFGEYTPYKDKIPWSYIDVPELNNYIRGKEYTVFKLPDFQFSVTICWENLFPDHVRQFVREGAQFIVNITNEAWFGRTAAPYQFVSMNVFRAVENRVFVVRCANTGISCFIDPRGRVVDTVKDGQGSEIFVRGVLNGMIIPLNSNTIYTQLGDWLVWASILVSFVLLLFALFKGKISIRH